MSTPRLAVVVTNHNYESFVGAAIDSALVQEDVEVIVVDDGSTDGSIGVLRAFGDRIRLVCQTNGGQAAAFNAGFAHVTAPIVVLLDADDVLAHGMTGRLEDAFADPTVAKVQFPLGLIDDDGGRIPGSMPADPSRLARGDLRDRLVVSPDDLMWQPTSGNAFRTSVLRQLLPMPVDQFRICADYYVSNLAAAHGTVRVIDETGGSYRVHRANNHYATSISPEALRANIARTRETNRLLLEHCRRLGLCGVVSDPSELRSVTSLGHRLVSVRIDPGCHPIAGETRRSLVRGGVEAALLRPDLSPLRRIGVAGWFALMGVVPRRFVVLAARPLVRLAEADV